MKYLKFTIVLLIVLSSYSFSQNPKIYFTVLGRKISTVVGNDVNVNGLYIGERGTRSFKKVGHKNTMAFGIAVDKKSNGKNIYLACGNGIQRSTDFGNSWKVVTNWEITEVMKLYISPENSNDLYLTSSFGIWKSTDMGNNWFKKTNGLKLVDQTYNECLAILPSNSKVLFLGTEDGICISKDGGNNWEPLALAGREIHDIQIAPYDENIMIAATEDAGIYISKDGGKNWKQMNMGIKGDSFYTIAFDPANKGTIYAGGYQTGINKSTDFCEKWIPIENEITDKTIRAIGIHSDFPNEVYVGIHNYGFYKSTDYGNSFQCEAECDGKITHLIIQ